MSLRVAVVAGKQALFLDIDVIEFGSFLTFCPFLFSFTATTIPVTSASATL
jgi:hypothetical protein